MWKMNCAMTQGRYFLGQTNFQNHLTSVIWSMFTFYISKLVFPQVEFYVCPVFCYRLRLSLILYEDKIKAKVWPRIDLAEIMGPMDSASRLVIGRYEAHLKKKITRKSTWLVLLDYLDYLASYVSLVSLVSFVLLDLLNIWRRKKRQITDWLTNWQLEIKK